MGRVEPATPGATPTGTTFVTARVDAAHPVPSVGERVALALRPDRLHLFDADTGNRLDA
jgi:hypothetical protein